MATALNYYVDSASGSDSNTGLSGAPWATLAQAVIGIGKVLKSLPVDVTITVTCSGTFGEDLFIGGPLTDETRVHWVAPLGNNTVGKTGTVTAVGGEAGPPLHNIERLTITAGFTPAIAATDVGKTIVFTDGAGEIASATILKVTVGPPSYVWVSQNIGDYAASAWVATATANILDMDACTINGDVTLAYRTQPVFAQSAATAVGTPKNWFVGFRCDNLVLAGDEIGVASCYVRNAGATWGTVSCRGNNGCRIGWTRTTGGGVEYDMTDALAAAWGLVGTTPVASNRLGNACNIVEGKTGYDTTYHGHFVTALQSIDEGELVASCVSGGYLRAEDGGIVKGTSMILSGEATTYGCFCAINGGTIEADYITMEAFAATGLTHLLYSAYGGTVRILSANIEGDNTGTGTCNGVVVGRFGNVEFVAGIPDEVIAQDRQIHVHRYGTLNVASGGITMTGARPGNATDIEIDGGYADIVGDITKGAVNTAASAFLIVRRGGRFNQSALDAFGLPATTNDWTTDYGAGGALRAQDAGSVISLGQVAGGNAGATTTGLTLRGGAKAEWTAGGAGLTGAAAVQIGSAAASVAWADAIDNDLAAGAPELCTAGARI